jgi:hypothetical protein
MRTMPSASTLSRASELSEDKTCRPCGATTPASPPGFVSAGSWDPEIWITEYVITYQERLVYTVSIMEFGNGKVIHETQYFGDQFEAPGWRAKWVEQK